MADTQRLERCVRKDVEVRLLSTAPNQKEEKVVMFISIFVGVAASVFLGVSLTAGSGAEAVGAMLGPFLFLLIIAYLSELAEKARWNRYLKETAKEKAAIKPPKIRRKGKKEPVWINLKKV